MWGGEELLLQWLKNHRLQMGGYLGNGFSQGQRLGRLPLHLVAGGVEGHLEVSHAGELGVLLLLGVHKVLYLRYLELPHSQEPSTRGDLVAECLADLGPGEGQLPIVEVQ